jgi:hypothetical protein
MKTLFFTSFLLLSLIGKAQFALDNASLNNASLNDAPIISEEYFKSSPNTIFDRKLYQRNTGMILGLQRGRYTSIELGGEAHWRKIAFKKPHIIGATANLEYDFTNNVIGYKAGMWMKRGRINLTYGANIAYFTNFKDGNRFAFGPSVGFRLLGLHLVNGINILTKDKNSSTSSTAKEEAALPVNTLYTSLRYYFPVENKFTWDRKTMKKKRERKRDRAKRKEQREKDRENGEQKGLRKLFNFHKKEKESKD